MKKPAILFILLVSLWGLCSSVFAQENFTDAFTFLKFYAGKKKVKIEIYRDDGHGGAYSLRHSQILK
ncbi:MAG: hypothetical protein ACE5HX_02795 [bacterium]